MVSLAAAFYFSYPITFAHEISSDRKYKKAELTYGCRVVYSQIDKAFRVRYSQCCLVCVVCPVGFVKSYLECSQYDEAPL